MRLIDADALKSALEIEQYNDYDDLLRTERLIDNAPTIERPHGEWVQEGTNERGEIYYHCSKCGAVDKMDGTQWLNFCWKCGADMRKENQ